ncbi:MULTISPECIES: serine hydrolase [unclassified Imperialibacter]|uniref:serine hydrolase domain-containing protein n=1 Tax=unclassified Imperialibacter TaxID=2629706 RepID=UPI00125A17B1|nr:MULTISPECIES: serine hydrolase [unclassified Imperialibacter]CAD5258021.1 Serine hydrolase [Imperialibacter sp. 75]CAD5261060.1 Serine hydrolase [Imperialibacter sp. 89]VVT25101.1 Beta-lactamase [Imperialibacter sp. EC-SDR9]
MKRLLLIFLAGTLLTCQPLQDPASSALTIGTPKAAGFSPTRLARIDASLQDWVNKGWINGAVGLIARNGKIVYYKGVGYDDLETKEALEREGIFRIASQTKAITSVAAMMLYEEGKFLLDDPVANYISSFKNAQVLDTFNPEDTTYTTVPANRAITIRDLLTHTSGIDYAQIGSQEAQAIYAKNNITAGLDVYEGTLDDAMVRLGSLPLTHQPGERWTYGLNTDLAGRLVEIWSGMTLEEFFYARIFKPLGMEDTYFNIPEVKADRLVNFFLEDSTGLKKSEQALGGDMNFPLRKKSYFSGGGGLSSTIYDYAIFLQMLLNGGEYDGVRLLSRNTVRMMTMNQIGDLTFGVNKFGLGFEVVSATGSGKFPSNEGTYSWGGAFSTSYWVDPKEKMVILFYQQMWGSHTNTTGNTFKVLAYQALVD